MSRAAENCWSRLLPKSRIYLLFTTPLLRRVSHFIPFDTRVNMYNALVMPYFNYCGAVWGNINKGLACVAGGISCVSAFVLVAKP